MVQLDGSVFAFLFAHVVSGLPHDLRHRLNGYCHIRYAFTTLPLLFNFLRSSLLPTNQTVVYISAIRLRALIFSLLTLLSVLKI